MNAWCFALPLVPPFTIHPWTNGQVFISDFNLLTKDHSVIVAEPFFGKKGKQKLGAILSQYVHFNLLFPDSTQTDNTCLALHVECHLFFSLSHCIIDKWHLDFIKVPRPLWQYDVTGGHFNISHKHLGSYYLPQPVALEEEEEEERCHVSGYRCLAGVWCRNHRTVLKKPKCIHSLAQFSLIFYLIAPFLLQFPGQQID